MDRIGRKTGSRPKGHSEPVCRFGPGGDFISVWPGEYNASSQPSSSGLGKLLTLLGEMITAVLGSELNSPSGVATSVHCLAGQIPAEEEKLKHAVRDSRTDEASYSAPTPVIESSGRFQGEPMLFGDDWGTGIGAGRKPKHRIRAYRRTSKKRHAFSLPGQGSLFEADFKSARTA